MKMKIYLMVFMIILDMIQPWRIEDKDGKYRNPGYAPY